MITKHITLKAHCNSCLDVLFTKPVKIEVPNIKDIEKINDVLLSIFPKNLKCQECEEHGIDYSYSFTHQHKFPPQVNQDELIDRAKAQIAATFDYNNDMPHKDREILREAWQKQLGDLLGCGELYNDLKASPQG